MTSPRSTARRVAPLGLALLALACDGAEPFGPGPSVTLAGRIVFVRGEPGSALTMRPDGSDVRELVGPQGGHPSPDWRRTAHGEGADERTAGCLTVTGTDGVARATSVCGLELHAITWAPDGRGLAARGGDSVFVVRIVNDRPVVAGRLRARGWGSIAWDPDGSRFATTAQESAAEGGATRLVTVSAAGRSLLNLGTVGPSTPLAWSPDRAWIAARVAGASSGETLRLHSPDGGLADRALVPATVVNPKWGFSFSPDGTRLLIDGNRPGTEDEFYGGYLSSDLFVVRIADGALTRVTPVHGTYTGAVWAPTGDRIAFSGSPGGSRHPQITADVFVVDVPVGATTVGTPVAITSTPTVGESVTAWY